MKRKGKLFSKHSHACYRLVYLKSNQTKERQKSKEAKARKREICILYDIIETAVNIKHFAKSSLITF